MREVQAIIAARCTTCHAERPRFQGLASPPKGVVLETASQIIAHKAAIREQAVVSRAMPLGNVTQMTDAERARIAAWIDHGARTE